tara:strand:- start:567 stop:1163 length:597 start_codon:yes stop_codon:yes gene_type:complete
MKIMIYGSGTNRSARPIWTADELGLEYELVATEELMTDSVPRSVHPQGKIPSAKVGDLMLFESVAICEYLCDIDPNNRLLGESGSSQRATYSQWASFAQSEIEAYLWHNFQLDRAGQEGNSFATVKDLNIGIASSGLKVINSHLESHEYFGGPLFTLTDIVVGWTLNWARRSELTEDFPAIEAYLAKLLSRPYCSLAK